jgi:hypothetical protein
VNALWASVDTVGARGLADTFVKANAPSARSQSMPELISLT